MSIRNIVWTLLLLIPVAVTAQDKFTLNGYIKDSLSGETLIGANLGIRGAGKGVTTNQFGYFSLTLQKGEYRVICSFVGYETKEIEIDLNRSKQLDVLLLPRSF